MKVTYTLPGVLPEATPAPITEADERVAEPFGLHLQDLRVPDTTDWRAVLRLSLQVPGATTMEPPPTPNGIDLRDGASQRAWWRAMLHKHMRLLETTGQEPGASVEAADQAAVQHMLGFLLESQRREDEIFARYFSEGRD